MQLLSRKYLYIWSREVLGKFLSILDKQNKHNFPPLFFKHKALEKLLSRLILKRWDFFFFFFFFTWCWLAVDNLSCWFRCEGGSEIYPIFCWCWPGFIVSFRRCIPMVNLKSYHNSCYSSQLTDLIYLQIQFSLVFKCKILQMYLKIILK